MNTANKKLLLFVIFGVVACIMGTGFVRVYYFFYSASDPSGTLAGFVFFAFCIIGVISSGFFLRKTESTYKFLLLSGIFLAVPVFFLNIIAGYAAPLFNNYNSVEGEFFVYTLYLFACFFVPTGLILLTSGLIGYAYRPAQRISGVGEQSKESVAPHKTTSAMMWVTLAVAAIPSFAALMGLILILSLTPEMKTTDAFDAGSTQEVSDVSPTPDASESDVAFLMDPGNWYNFDSATNGFSVLFPTTPNVTTGKQPFDEFDTITTFNTYNSSGDIYEFQVEKDIFADNLDLANPEKQILPTVLERLLHSTTDNTLVSSDNAFLGDNPALDFLFDMSDNYMEKGRIINDGQMIYIVEMGYPADKYDDTIYNNFIDSFKLQQN